jgi:mannose-6-phosphate isomerase-like protein (cupin superfamily)
MFLTKDDIEPFAFGSLRIHDYTEGKRLRSSFMLVDVPPGASHPHSRPRQAEKIYCVLAGTVHFEIDGEETVLEAQSAAVVQPGQLFAYRNDGENPARMALVWTPHFDDAEEEVLE